MYTSAQNPFRLRSTHQPDCIAAVVIAHDVLAHGAGYLTVASPIDTARRAREGRMPPPPLWMRSKIGGGR
jgi:hypothetical protein